MHRATLALAALATALPVQAAEPVVLKAASPWNVEFADDKCLLLRTFGDGKALHLLAFDQYSPGAAAGLTVSGPSFRRFTSDTRMEVRLFDTQRPAQIMPLTGNNDSYGPAVLVSTFVLRSDEVEPGKTEAPSAGVLPLLDLTFGKQVQFLELKQGSREVKLEIGRLDGAFKVLNDCTLDLVRSWGLDPDRLRTARSGPRWTNQLELVRRIANRYPQAALAQGEQAIIRMRVIVSAEGTVENCTILKATKTKELDSPACEVMRRARFEPALDAEGKPIRSFYTTAIRYLIG